jgi:hypothetical protein
MTDSDERVARINAKIGAEVETTMREHLPSCSEWTEVAINSKLLDIIAKVSGRAFVGEDLYQDPEYLDCAKNYTLLLFAAVFEIKPIRSWLKPFLVPRLPAIQQLRNVEKRAVRGLEPLVRERMEAEKNDPDWQKPDDMIQWLINHSAEQGGLSVEYLAEQQRSTPRLRALQISCMRWQPRLSTMTRSARKSLMPCPKTTAKLQHGPCSRWSSSTVT